MKRFFQLLLAGLFLVAVGFISEPKIISIDDDVGTSVFIEIQQEDFEIANEFEFVSDLSYQEVGIVPTESLNIVLLEEANYELYYKTLVDNTNLIDQKFTSIYNERKNRDKINSSDSYKTQRKNLNYNKHFRLARSRMVLDGEYVTQTINA